MMHGKEAALFMLRAIGARAFVHSERYKTKFDYRSGKSKRYSYAWDDSNMYLIRINSLDLICSTFVTLLNFLR